MNVETWALFCATETVLCFIPGPAVLFVVSSALTRGSRAGLQASLGILAANTVYFVFSALGVGAVLVASRPVFLAIKWIGAAYLVYLGIRMIVTRTAPESAHGTPGGRPGPRVFWNGFLTQIANPKALIFFSALLPQFIDPDDSAATQIAILGVSSVLIEFAVLAIYVASCRAATRWVRVPGAGAWLVRAGGVLLIVAGAKLAATRGQ